MTVNSNMSMEMVALTNKAKDALNIAVGRGYAAPADYTAANEIVREASQVRAALVAGAKSLPQPTKAVAVAGWIADTARARIEWREQQSVADELIDRATREAMAAIVAAVPGFLALICDDFDKEVGEFKRLLSVAPRGVTAHMTGKEFEVHAQLLRAVDALTSTVMARARLALLTVEAESIGSEALWLVLDPAESATLDAVASAITDFRTAFPSTIEEWERVVILGLGMARGGDVIRRKEEYQRFRLASGMASDGGRHDKTYGEAASLPGGAKRPRGLADPVESTYR